MNYSDYQLAVELNELATGGGGDIEAVHADPYLQRKITLSLILANVKIVPIIVDPRHQLFLRSRHLHTALFSQSLHEREHLRL